MCAAAAEMRAFPLHRMTDPKPADDPQPSSPQADALLSAFLDYLEGMPPLTRVAFLMRQGFRSNYADIARATGMPAEDVRKIVNETRTCLREARLLTHTNPAATDRSQGNYVNASCIHQDQIRPVVPATDGCEECLRLGGRWVHLRMCLVCGHIGCCDSSKGKHATGHFHETGHPIMQSAQPGESWRWCYVDQKMI